MEISIVEYLYRRPKLIVRAMISFETRRLKNKRRKIGGKYRDQFFESVSKSGRNKDATIVSMQERRSRFVALLVIKYSTQKTSTKRRKKKKYIERKYTKIEKTPVTFLFSLASSFFETTIIKNRRYNEERMNFGQAKRRWVPQMGQSRALLRFDDNGAKVMPLGVCFSAPASPRKSDSRKGFGREWNRWKGRGHRSVGGKKKGAEWK